MLLTSKTARRSRRRRLAYLIAPTILVAGFGVAVTSPAAHAAACTKHSGKTSTIRETANGPEPSNGTVWVMSDTCSDLEVFSVGHADSYEGWLFSTSTRRWSACAKGLVPIGASIANPVPLCTGVLAGTQMVVSTGSGTQRSLTIED